MSIARKIGNLGTALDSAALSTFLSKGTTDGEFDTIAWGDVTGKPSYIDSSLATQLFDSAYIQLRQSAVSSGGLDSAAVTTLIDSSYVANRAGTGSSGFIMYNYNATSGQTAFQDSDTAGNVLSYTADGILVYYNGLLLADEDYTATDGSAVTLTEGADSGAQITIGKWNLTGSGSSGSAGGGGPSFTGDRVAVQGGYMDGTNTYSNVIDYFSITASSGVTASDFGDLIIGGSHGAAAGDGSRNIFTSRWYGNDTNRIDYFDYATLANAGDFGDQISDFWNASGYGDGTYAIFGGGRLSDGWNSQQRVTVQTLGNASQVGSLYNGYYYGHAALCDGTYGVMGGGQWNSGGFGGTDTEDTIQYATTIGGNCSLFGTLTAVRSYLGACCDGTYGLFGGGYTGSVVSNVIDYITVQTTSNATDFGDCSSDLSWGVSSASDGTYAVFCGGNQTQTASVIDRVTTATAGNATDIGDLSVDRRHSAASSGSPS